MRSEHQKAKIVFVDYRKQPKQNEKAQKRIEHEKCVKYSRVRIRNLVGYVPIVYDGKDL